MGRLLDQGFYADRKGLLEELNHLVRSNYLYYNPTLAEYKLQGRSMEIGLNRYVCELAPQEKRGDGMVPAGRPKK